MATKEGPTLAPVNTSEIAKNNGTIHVRVVRARNLPTLDFGRRQEPFVLAQLEGSSPKSWGSTDPAYTGGNAPEWTDSQNREIELYYDAALQADKAVVAFEVYSDDSGADLIGTGQLDVSKIVQTKPTGEQEFQVRLAESTSSLAPRGELVVQVWFGPPVRKAFRAVGRASKLLDVRDAVVSYVWSLGLHASSPFAKYLSGPVDFLKNNKKISMALAAVLGMMAAGLGLLFMVIAVPTATIATLTFPFWIIPFLIAAFFTAPLWIPVVVLVSVFGAFAGAFCVGLGITSRPARRQGAKFTTRIKHSDVGKRVVYEKTE